MTTIPTIIGDIWLNTKPLSAGDFAGNAVLVDFWTYSCVNCQRTLPHLRRWWDLYGDAGFLLVGIHTPEFEFEKDPKNVAGAIRRLGVNWPVVLDNKYANWNNFSNRYWPAKYLFDRTGNLVYTHFGEGAYAETERAIQKALRMDGKAPHPIEESHAHGKVCFIATPELYCGFARGRIANPGGHRRGEEAVYAYKETLANDTIALSGRFLAEAEFVEAREAGAAILLHFRGTEVNLVLEAPHGKAEVEVFLDGAPLPSSLRGKHVGEDSLISVHAATLYNLIRADHLIEGILTVKARTAPVRAYAFTFSGCEE